jgi:2'-5' RNA ligase
MRLFFGLEPDSSGKAAIADWRDRFGPCDGRSVRAGNFHITLAFLGELESRRLEALCAAADAIGREGLRAQVELVFDRVGFWPAAGIYWMGPSVEDAALTMLAARLQRVGQRFGARRDRRTYTPHLTLYRGCTTPPPPPLVMPSIRVGFDAFVLFESCRGRQGVRYEPIAEWSLA